MQSQLLNTTAMKSAFVWHHATTTTVLPAAKEEAQQQFRGGEPSQVGSWWGMAGVLVKLISPAYGEYWNKLLQTLPHNFAPTKNLYYCNYYSQTFFSFLKTGEWEEREMVIFKGNHKNEIKTALAKTTLFSLLRYVISQIYVVTFANYLYVCVGGRGGDSKGLHWALQKHWHTQSNVYEKLEAHHGKIKLRQTGAVLG